MNHPHNLNRRFLLRALSAAGVCMVLAPRGAFAQSATDDAGAFIAEFAQKGIVDILAANIPNSEKQKRFRVMFTQDFDIPAIGKFVLSRYARTVSPEDLETFSQLFEEVIVYTWSRRFSDYNGQTLKVTSTVPDGADGAIVKSTVIGKGGDSFGVDWRLRKRPDGYKVVDVIVAGVSMAITYRQDYTAVIGQKGGIPGLLAQLRQQVDDLKRQQQG